MKRRGDETAPAAVAALAAALLPLVLLGAPGARAQSPFSLVNLGGEIGNYDARLDGRGGWGLAESDSAAPCFRNLAGLAGLDRIALTMSGFGESVRSESGAGARTNNRAMTPNVRAAVPLLGGRGVLTAGFLARRSTQYGTLVPQTWLSGTDTIQGQESFVREGTQFQVPLGAAWRLRAGLSAAASLNLERGVIRERQGRLVTGPVDLAGNVTDRSLVEVLEDQINGTSVTLGLRWQPLPAVELGAVCTPAHTWEVDRTLELTGVAGRQSSRYTLELPAEWAAGAAVRVAPRWRVGCDGEWRPLSRLKGRADWEPDMTDEWSLALGCERHGASRRHGGLDNLPLRFGLLLRRWGYRVGGAEIDEARVSLGTGFPLRGGAGRLDCALGYGWVGDRAENGYRDRVLRLSVSVVGLEKWW